MPARLMHRRTLQVCLLLTVALLFSRVPQWEHGSWILISVGAIIGPFSPLLTYRKSMLRGLGTTAGLLLSAMLIAAFSNLPWAIPILGVVLAYSVAFTAQQDYRYFIMVITVAIALNFADMYVPFTPFEPLSFFSSRAMGVFIGIAIYVTLEWFVFGKQEFINWAKASNDEFAVKLATIIKQIDSLDASNLSLNQPLLTEVSQAQATHAESLSSMRSDLDVAVVDRAKRLQRIAQRLQMSVYRALCGSTHSDINITMRTRRLQAVLDQQCV